MTPYLKSLFRMVQGNATHTNITVEITEFGITITDPTNNSSVLINGNTATVMTVYTDDEIGAFSLNNIKEPL